MIKDYSKIAIAAVLFIFLAFVTVQIAKFTGRRGDAQERYDEVKAEFDRAQADHDRLQNEYSYFSNPDNLAKELRSRFNYTLPGERILILVEEEAPETESAEAE